MADEKDEKDESKFKDSKEYDSSHNDDKYGQLPSGMAEAQRKADKER